MSTIPSTFSSPGAGPQDRSGVPGTYTVVGGRRAAHAERHSRLSFLVLNRSGRIFTSGFLQGLRDMGFEDILSVEGLGGTYDVENLSRRHPGVRFLLLQKALSLGEIINLGIKEARATFVFVLWDDMRLAGEGLSTPVMERLFQNQPLCTVPVLRNLGEEVLPTLQAPVFARKHLKVLSLEPVKAGAPSLFPFDSVGIYHKERFLLLGGYDPQLTNPHWQRLDFGFRAHLWGESIQCDTSLLAAYLGEPPMVDTSPDKDYRRFYLKNLVVRFNGNEGYIPVSRFPRYFLKGGGGFFQARREFQEARQWVRLNRLRFQFDAVSITDLWEDGGA